jgi:bifunctional non-homologous end joining protein LigD
MQIGAQPPTREVHRGRRSVRLTRLDQVWWPGAGITKGDVAAYYEAIAPVLVPHLRDRPFTLKRYPNGPRGPFFWIKDAPEAMPAWIRTCPLPAKSRRGAPVDYPLVDDELGLLWMVEFGCVDLHLWYSRCDRPANPDYVLFDLDPAGVGFGQVAEAAVVLRDALEALGLEGHVKTTGGEGLHVQVPIARRYTYEQTRGFSEIVTGALRRARPDLVTTERSKTHRRGVFVDTKMNGHGMTIASVYSVRPVPGAAVATPLRWSEVRAGLDPAAFTMDVVRARVEREGDLFAPLLRGRQRLDRALQALDLTTTA